MNKAETSAAQRETEHLAAARERIAELESAWDKSNAALKTTMKAI